MSNLELRPEEISTEAVRPISHLPVQRQLAPREVPLGGPRAMLVRRTVPHRELRTVGAWCFVDDYGPAEPQMVVPPHPHTGLQTVTWLVSGEVLHQDSVGSQQLVRPGSLSLMTAGRGISHAETATAGSPTLRGLQLWVALPAGVRHSAPAFEHHADLPVERVGGVTATVVMGTLGDTTSPATTYTPLVAADLSIGGSGSIRLNRSWEYAVLALDDGLVVEGEPVAAGWLVYLGCDRARLDLEGDTRALLLGGVPFEEELLMWWNFVGRSHDEIVAAREEWSLALAGEPTRFGRVESYNGPPMPAPALPSSRLRPRGRS